MTDTTTAGTTVDVTEQICAFIAKEAEFSLRCAEQAVAKMLPSAGTWPSHPNFHAKTIDRAIEATYLARAWASAEVIARQFPHRASHMDEPGFRMVPVEFPNPTVALCQMLTRIATATVAVPAVIRAIDAHLLEGMNR